MDPAAWAVIRREFVRVEEAALRDRPALLASLPSDVRLEVESLLGALDAATPLLSAAGDFDFRPGSIVGPYRLLEELGRGEWARSSVPSAPTANCSAHSH